MIEFPVIDLIATGKNIQRLRTERHLSVYDLQMFFGFEFPQAIYKWQRGQSLPSVDNLYALSALLGVSMNEILVPTRPKLHRKAGIPLTFLNYWKKFQPNKDNQRPESTSGFLCAQITLANSYLFLEAHTPANHQFYSLKRNRPSPGNLNPPILYSRPYNSGLSHRISHL